MIKTQIGLGVLSFPSVFDTLGLIPGVILLCVIAGITTWSNYIVGTFKLNHRHVYGVDDVGQMLFGRFGKEVLAVAFMGCRFQVKLSFYAFLILITMGSLHHGDWIRHA